MTRFICVAGRYVQKLQIDAVLFHNSQSAAVWFGGRAEPLQALYDEVGELREYVTEVMS